MEKEEKKSLIDPITHEKADEAITEKEAKARGYLDFEFMMKYLEDENEYTKYFVIDGKKVVVHLTNPTTQYKKKLSLNYERTLQETEEQTQKDNIPTVVIPSTCNLGDEGCLSCGS